MGLNIMATIGLDGSGFAAGIRQVEGGAQRAAESLKNLAVSAFGIYGIEQAIHKTIETAEKLVDTSHRLGIGIEKLQELGYAARMNGADIEQLTTFIEKLNSTRIDPKKAPFFDKLGIGSPGNMPVEDLIVKLSASVKSRSSQEVIGPLREIGGRGVGSMIPMLKDDMAELADEAHRLGAIMKTEDAVMLKFVADQMTVLSQVMTAQLAPALVRVTNWILWAVNRIRASGTFFGDFSTKGVPAIKDALKELFSGGLFKGTDMATFKDYGKRLSEAWGHAGAASENDLQDMDAATEAMIARMMARQKEMEKINEAPDFSEITDKAAKHHAPYTDSLLRVGNFFGGSQSGLEAIGREHTHLLKRIATAAEHSASHAGRTGASGGHRASHL